MRETNLLVQALQDPHEIASLDFVQWDLLIRQARRANLLGKLAFRLLRECDVVIPQQARAHLDSALTMADRQGLAIRWEVSCLAKALLKSGVKVILLKGAAYVMEELPTSRGRTFSDVDILVPKERIGEVESALMIHGWQGSHHDEYDQRYYRNWMHEIPPMQHVRRGTTIDVHHTILPETARIKVNTAALLENPQPVVGFENVFVLKPIDMVLHSATHLFHEGELDNGLRDLFDLDSMFRQFSNIDGFWAEILPRAKALGLERPLFYAIMFSRKILDTPFPERLVREIEAISISPLLTFSMQNLYTRVLRPNHVSCHSRGAWLARKVLYIRSHWIRMPTFMLVRHLTHKAMIRPGRNTVELRLNAK